MAVGVFIFVNHRNACFGFYKCNARGSLASGE